MQETHLRSLIKGISWRIFGTLATMLIAFLITHNVSISFYIGLLECLTKIGFFYAHERLWHRIPFGRIHPKR